MEISLKKCNFQNFINLAEITVAKKYSGEKLLNCKKSAKFPGKYDKRFKY